MTLTEALVNSLGPWVIEPSGFTSFLVLRVRKPWSLSRAASWFRVVVPAEYRSNIALMAPTSADTRWMPPGCSVLCRSHRRA